MTDELMRFQWDRLQRVSPKADDYEQLQGAIKVEPEDFVVEEVPLYEPCGEGEHVYLWIEKRDFTASQLAAHISSAVGIRTREIGMAGRKDRRAVTRQFVSIPAECADKVAAIDNDQVKVLTQQLHSNKLRTGHLRGNRFVIRVRVVVSSGDNQNIDLDRLQSEWQSTAGVLQSVGMPNYFGEQRFGNYGDTAIPGMALIRPDQYPNTPRPRSHHAKKLFLSAVQSAVFNKVLTDRITAGDFANVLAGDVVQFDKSKSIFTVEDATAEQPRFDSYDIVTTGPIWGMKMPRPNGQPGEMELAALHACGLKDEDFIPLRKALPGARRPLRVIPEDLKIEFQDGDPVFSFYLPSGSYATVLLREFLSGWRSAEKSQK